MHFCILVHHISSFKFSYFSFFEWLSMILLCYYCLSMQLLMFPSIKWHLKRIFCTFFMSEHRKWLLSSCDSPAHHHSPCYHSSYVEVEEQVHTLCISKLTIMWEGSAGASGHQYAKRLNRRSGQGAGGTTSEQATKNERYGRGHIRFF